MRFRVWLFEPSRPPWWMPVAMAYFVAVAALAGLLLHRDRGVTLLLIGFAVYAYRLGHGVRERG